MENANHAEFLQFASDHVAPQAAMIDRTQQFPEQLIRQVAERGYLAPWLPKEVGGRNFDALAVGLLHEALGAACTATRCLLTAHGMVALSVQRWGNAATKDSLLKDLAVGKKIAAFALSEPEIGSDAAKPQTVARKVDGGYQLDGDKHWITFGQRADTFLVLAALDDKPTAFIVQRDNPGLCCEPIDDMLGARGAMLASLSFNDCRIDANDLLAREGLGFTMVAATALDLGRFLVAWGCSGLLRACLDATVAYTSTRRQFGTEIRNHQLVAQLITRMMTAHRCAELLCRRAATLRNQKHHSAVQETLIAKYYASTAAMQVASDAVQLHGANGVSDEFPVARLFRDAKIMEIIEGSTQILEAMIAQYARSGTGQEAAAQSTAVDD